MERECSQKRTNRFIVVQKTIIYWSRDIPIEIRIQQPPNLGEADLHADRPRRLRQAIISQYLNAACKTPIVYTWCPHCYLPRSASTLCSPPASFLHRFFFSIRKGGVCLHTSKLCGTQMQAERQRETMYLYGRREKKERG